MAGEKQRMDQLKSMNLEGLSKYTKDEMAAFILDTQSQKTDTSSEGAIMKKLEDMETNLLINIKGLQTTCDSLRTDLRAEKARNDTLQQTVDVLLKTTASQQRFLERLDARERGRNLIVIGLPENGTNVGGTSTDENKLSLAFDRMSTEVENFEAIRLGKERSDGSSRPVLVIFGNGESRKSVLSKKDALGKDKDFGSLRIKKDQHPALRKEWKRMFDAEAEEMRKPENAGCTIEFDRKQRVIMRDGKVIDRFQPNF